MSVRVRRIAGRWISSWFNMAVLFVLAAALVGIGLGRNITQRVAPVSVAAVTTHSAFLEESDSLAEGFWRRRRSKMLRSRQDSGRNQLGVNPFDTGARQTRRLYSAYSGNYRTVCVRLCDGYYFPISASTSRTRFAADEQKCQSKCSSDSRLFYYSNAGGNAETMRDRRGRAYADLKTAFLYRTVYDKTCQCRPDPWSEEAKQRHAMYATPGWKKQAKHLARLDRRRARQRRRPRIVRSAPAIILWENNQQNGNLAGRGQFSPYIRSAPEPTARPIPRRRFSEVRMGLGRPAAIKRQSRPRTNRRPSNKSWRKQIFNNSD